MGDSGLPLSRPPRPEERLRATAAGLLPHLDLEVPVEECNVVDPDIAILDRRDVLYLVDGVALADEDGEVRDEAAEVQGAPLCHPRPAPRGEPDRGGDEEAVGEVSYSSYIHLGHHSL